MTSLETNALEVGNFASQALSRVTEARNYAKATVLAKATNESPEALKSPWGIMFDLGWDFKGLAGHALTNLVLDQIAPGQDRTGKRAESHHARMRKILANGLYAFFFLRPACVAYYRKGDADCYSRKDKPTWYNAKSLRKDTDALAKAGLLQCNKGEHGKGTSTYKITQKLLILSMEAGVTERDLAHVLWRGRLLRVYETNRKGRRLVDLASTKEADQWQAQLASFNAFTSQHEIALSLSDEERRLVLTRLNNKRQKGLPAFYRPALLRTGLYRSFNQGSFAFGGRLYGGWWQHDVPSNLRGKIIIDGQATVELDYSCFHIRMLYNLLGLPCDDDAYFLEEVGELEQDRDLPKGYYRGAIKSITQALINSPKGVKGERCKLPEGVSFHPHFTRAEVRQMIERKHKPIACFFATGKGLELQRMDSDLALQIIINLKEKGILALPIHDSFIVQNHNENELLNEMNICYKNKFNYDPFVNKKTPI